MPAKEPLLYSAQRNRLEALGERLRLARLRRDLSIDVVCGRAAISRMTLYRVEAGNAAISMGTLARVLAVLGLDSDLDLLAANDKVGRQLQDRELPPRRRAPRKTSQPQGGGSVS